MVIANVAASTGQKCSHREVFEFAFWGIGPAAVLPLGAMLPFTGHQHGSGRGRVAAGCDDRNPPHRWRCTRSKLTWPGLVPMSLIEIKVPDIGDFSEVTVIELLVVIKPGDTIKAEQSPITEESGQGLDGNPAVG